METLTTTTGFATGDLATWVNVFVTAVAVGAAIYAGWQANAILKIEMKRELDRDFSTQIEQAKSISAWSRPSISYYPNGRHHTGRAIEAVVLNQSQQAVYDIRLAWWFENEKVYESRIDLVPPSESMTSDLPQDLLLSISKDPNFVPVLESFESAYKATSAVCELLRIEVKFRDAENRIWVRDQLGVLKLN